MTFYFAYGSNMLRADMARRCPAALAIGPARLDGWRYVVMTEGYATIVPTAGSAVHGVLWRLAPRDIAVLNAYENLDGGLYRRATVAVAHNGHHVRALTYVGRTLREGRAKPGYQDRIVAAARDWELPDRYVAELSRWTNGARRRKMVAEAKR